MDTNCSSLGNAHISIEKCFVSVGGQGTEYKMFLFSQIIGLNVLTILYFKA